tara:strand:+ start:9758 stop:10600 length:843 start_codon:yes stop_codon:yes gene_type:complete
MDLSNVTSNLGLSSTDIIDKIKNIETTTNDFFKGKSGEVNELIKKINDILGSNKKSDEKLKQIDSLVDGFSKNDSFAKEGKDAISKSIVDLQNTINGNKNEVKFTAVTITGTNQKYRDYINSNMDNIKKYLKSYYDGDIDNNFLNLFVGVDAYNKNNSIDDRLKGVVNKTITDTIETFTSSKLLTKNLKKGFPSFAQALLNIRDELKKNLLNLSEYTSKMKGGYLSTVHKRFPTKNMKQSTKKNYFKFTKKNTHSSPNMIKKIKSRRKKLRRRRTKRRAN